MQQLNDALTLARQARAQAGGIHSTGTPDISLSTEEFEKALDYCRTVFHEKFMLNENLKREYTEFRNDPQSMPLATKNRIRKQFRGAFRNWITKLVGDWNFFMAVLQHGIFDSTSRREFLQALRQQRQAAMSSSVDAHHAGEDGGPTTKARVDNDELRQAALHARLEYRKGARLSQKVQEDRSIYASFPYKDKLLLLQFDNGTLLKRRKEADNAYGHSRDVDCLSLAERVVLRAWSTDILDNYFNA